MRKKILITASALVLTASACTSERTAGEPVAVDHITAEEAGVRGEGNFTTLREFEELEPADGLGDASMARRSDRAVAVTPHGVVGVGHPDGGERWRYLVHGETEVSVDLPSGTDALVVTHPLSESPSSPLVEVVLDPGTGEILSSAELHADAPVAHGLGTERTRILIDGDGRVSAQDRSRGTEEVWSVEAADRCEASGGTIADLRTASEAESVYLSLQCRGTDEGHLVALSMGTGETTWDTAFAGRPDQAPDILVVDSGSSGGGASDVVQRALRGEFGADHLYVNGDDGTFRTPEVLSAASVTENLTVPAEDTDSPPRMLLVGTDTHMRASAAHAGVALLIEDGVLSFDDLDEAAYTEEAGEPRLHTSMDPVQFFGDVGLNHLTEALATAEP
ncbi:PQQ-like domain-containing protein [Nocardiopsis flavescens]|uniref:PQQ-like domain-containing protein n=1 Tax=Nocardiopsis flavescens TaxID=758803 RepID=A0A1M6NA06_9ACTN|nr:PQQ-binding-like beta-propeller repeat protein [Nocardiopsis flavescens]SHJ92533.1 PQQ-like domain-containing protein [Nocardiopsis flavescens]